MGSRIPNSLQILPFYYNNLVFFDYATRRKRTHSKCTLNSDLGAEFCNKRKFEAQVPEVNAGCAGLMFAMSSLFEQVLHHEVRGVLLIGYNLYCWNMTRSEFGAIDVTRGTTHFKWFTYLRIELTKFYYIFCLEDLKLRLFLLF